MVRFLWLVKVGHFELQDRVLLVLLLLVTTFFWPLVPPKLLDAAQWNFVCCFVMAIPRDVCNDFSKFLFFTDFRLFSWKNIVFSWYLVAPIIRSSMKFCMLLCYGGPSGCLQRFFEIFIFHPFSPVFLKKKIVFSLYLVPPKLMDAAQWNFVRCFVMAIPRDVCNDFSKFLFFTDFCLFFL